MLAKFLLVRPVPPIFKFLEFLVVALYSRMKKYMSNPKKLCPIQETELILRSANFKLEGLLDFNSNKI